MSIALKQLIKYDNANYVEATWIDIVDEQEVIIKCTSYSDSQIYLLREDAMLLNTPLDEYEDTIKEVENNAVFPTEEELEALRRQEEENKKLALELWKNETINGLEVTISSGKCFKADPQDISLMQAALTASSILEHNSSLQAMLPADVTVNDTFWLMKDGKMQKVTKEELSEALLLALLQYQKILSKYSNILHRERDA